MAALTSCENALLLFLPFLLPSPKMPPLLHPPIVQYPVGKLPTGGGSVERGNFFQTSGLVEKIPVFLLNRNVKGYHFSTEGILKGYFFYQK